jgi:hypothetical protein
MNSEQKNSMKQHLRQKPVQWDLTTLSTAQLLLSVAIVCSALWIMLIGAMQH